jgi:lysyl-tRNA synthetase class 2
MDEINELIQERVKKLGKLKESGVDPYGGPFDVKNNVKDILDKHNEMNKEELAEKNEKCTIAGRIIAYRDFGKAAFAHVQDGTGKIQVYFRKDILGETYKMLKNYDVGDIIGLSGKLFRTKTNELTIEVDDFILLCKSLRPLPEKWHGLRDVETRYRQRYVDLIVNPQVRELFIKRSRLIKAIRNYFDERGFIEVETPMMHLVPGGATARPFKTHHVALGLELYLRIAPELYLKRLLVGGYERIYEINKNFRNEGISTKHNPEFTMLEFYIAYVDYEYLMRFTEELITYICNEIVGGLRVPYGENAEQSKTRENASTGKFIDFTPPWPRVSMLDALRKEGVDSAVFEDKEKARECAAQNNIDISTKPTHGKILDEIFKKKVEHKLIQPVFIVDYPVELSPLAKRKKRDPEFVERFELFIGGREIANAFSELNDPNDQNERFLQQQLDRQIGDEEAHLKDDDFVRALEYGMPPAAGEGIGIDRLLMLLTNSSSIRDVILFPQLKPEHI